MTAHFVLNEVFAAEKIYSDVFSVVEFSNIIDACGFPNSDTFVTDQFLSMKYVSGETIAQYLYKPEHFRDPILRDSILRFGRTVDQLSVFNADEIKLSKNLLDDIPDHVCYVISLNESDVVGVIGGGPFELEGWWDAKRMQVVSDSFSAVILFRLYVANNHMNEEFIWGAAKTLFPNLYFNENLGRLRFSNLCIAKANCTERVFYALSYLNDFAQSDFNVEPHVFIANAAGRGIELSPESPKTKQSPEKINQRNILVGVKELCCEWHIKFDYDKGRLHFHTGLNLSQEINSITGGKVVVGIFCEHLDT